MRYTVVRTWLVCFFTLLSLACLNAEGVYSWYIDKGEGREEILRGLTELKRIHSEIGIGSFLTWLDCAAGPVFEGSYKDQSKCRDVAERPFGLAWNRPHGVPATSSPSPAEGRAMKPSPPEVPMSRPVLMPDRIVRETAGLPQSQPETGPSDPARDDDPVERTLEGPGTGVEPHVGTESPNHADAHTLLKDDDFKEDEPGPPETGLAPSQEDRLAPVAEYAVTGAGAPDPGDPPSPAIHVAQTAARGGGDPIEAIPTIASAEDSCDRGPERSGFQSVLLVGDSLAHGLALSLGRDLKDRRGAAFSFVAKVSSGLNNPNLFNWEKSMRMLIENGAPDLVLIMMGVNDANNHIREGNRLCAVGTPEWEQAYESRVESFLRIASETKVPVCWIGVPVVREEGLQNRVVLANMAAKNACSRVDNCRFIDTFEVLCDENKKYTNYFREVDGSSVRIRAKDGIHFSMEGGNLLSRHILQKLD